MVAPAADPAWSEATGHRFTRELADGILADTERSLDAWLADPRGFLDGRNMAMTLRLKDAPTYRLPKTLR